MKKVAFKTFQLVLTVALLIFIIMLISAIPAVIKTTDHFWEVDWQLLFQMLKSYTFDFFTFKVWVYDTHWMSRNFLLESPDYIITSFLYLASSSIVGLTVGISLAFLLYRNYTGKLQGLLYLLNNIPDFIFMISSQLFVVWFYTAFNFQLASITPYRSRFPILFLPLLAMSFYASFYVLKISVIQLYQQSMENYVVFAKSQGLSRKKILRKHLLPALLPVLNTDLYKIVGLLIGNLFIAESLFSLPGITKVLFHFAYTIFQPAALANYQYYLVVNSLMFMIFIYFAVILVSRLFLRIIRGVFVHE